MGTACPLISIVIIFSKSLFIFPLCIKLPRCFEKESNGSVTLWNREASAEHSIEPPPRQLNGSDPFSPGAFNKCNKQSTFPHLNQMCRFQITWKSKTKSSYTSRNSCVNKNMNTGVSCYHIVIFPKQIVHKHVRKNKIILHY